MSADHVLAACVAAPADDGPRHVWGDAVGGERGELVAVQLRLASGAGTPAEVGALLARQRALVAAHGAAWSGLAAIAGVASATFRRGFVEAIAIDAETAYRQRDAIRAAAPLLAAVAVRGLGDDDADGTRNVWWASAGLVGLDLGVLAPSRIRDHMSNKQMTHVEALAFTGLYQRLAYTLRSTSLPHLARLTLSCSADALADLRACLPTLDRLRALDVAVPVELADLASSLPPALRELTIRGAGGTIEASLVALARAPTAATLEQLRLPAGELVVDSALFAPFSALRVLDLGQTRLAPAAARALLWQPLPALAALRVPHPGGEGGDAWLVALAERFGARLDQLVVVGDRAAPPALASLVAGEVRTVARADAYPAFGLGGPARSPAWEDPTFVREASA